MFEYASCLRDPACRDKLPSFVYLDDYHSVTAADLSDNPDAIMEAVAFYVNEHMGYMGDEHIKSLSYCMNFDDPNCGVPKVQPAAWTLIESGSRGCTAGRSYLHPGMPAAYCGDCEDFAILREALMRVLGISADCAYCADQFKNYYRGNGGHTFNLVFYRGKWRVMDYKALGTYNEMGDNPHKPHNIWNDKNGDYWCYRKKDKEDYCDMRLPGIYAVNYYNGETCPASQWMEFELNFLAMLPSSWTSDFLSQAYKTYYNDQCP